METRTRIADAPPILVTGGTGTLGRLVVARLLDAGRDVRVLSRHGADEPSPRGTSGARAEFITGDVSTGDGLGAAISGTGVIIHCAGSAKGDDDKVRHLVAAASQAGTKHLVFISVVGADRIPVSSTMDRAMFGYFASKLAAERVVADSGLPWSTMRATQFHDLTLKTVQGMASLPIVPVPAGFQFQPVDAGEVADRLVELALGSPAGLVPAIGGPRPYAMADLVRSYLRATGRHRLLLSIPLFGAAARAFRAGANLAPDRAVGRRSWEDFLAAKLGPSGDGKAGPPADRPTPG